MNVDFTAAADDDLEVSFVMKLNPAGNSMHASALSNKSEKGFERYSEAKNFGSKFSCTKVTAKTQSIPTENAFY